MSEALPEAVERSLNELLINLGELATEAMYIDIYPVDPDDPRSPYIADMNGRLAD